MSYGEVCNKENDWFKLVIHSICDKSSEKAQVSDIKDFNTCNPQITIKSKYGCVAFTYSSWIEMSGINKEVMIALLVMLGTSFLFLGYILKPLFAFLIISSLGGICLFLSTRELVDIPIYCKFKFYL
jgi:hypothetical protein